MGVKIKCSASMKTGVRYKLGVPERKSFSSDFKSTWKLLIGIEIALLNSDSPNTVHVSYKP